MKKMVMLALCLFVLTASGLFALDKAVGGGLLYNLGFSRGTIDNYPVGYDPMTGQLQTASVDWNLTRSGFGAFGFFGFGQYAEANLGIMYKNPTTLKVKVGGQSEKVTASDVGLDSTAALQLGIYGKYPIPLNDTLVFFPTVGMDFEITLGSGSDDKVFKWWHDIWLRAGAGVDFFLTERLFLRGHMIYGLAIPVGGESDLGLKAGHGMLLKVGLGFML